MADLKPCPFCGGEAEIWEDKVFKTFAPQCKECFASCGRYTTKERAIRHWNTRKPEEAVVAELEKEKVLNTCDKSVGFNNGIRKAIEIVRGKE